jgi:hypothetical protein
MPDADWCAWYHNALFRPYQWLMLKAYDVQGDGPGPWQKVKSPD